MYRILRRSVGAAAIALGVVASGQMPALGQELITLDAPVMVTSIGQNLDAFALQLAVQRAGVQPSYDNHFEPEDLGEERTLFLAVGASLKGFGEAGITIEDEIARAGHLIDAAEEKGVTVVMVHLGGEAARDELSNQLIEVVAPRSDLIILVPESDTDGMIKAIADANGIPTRETRSAIYLPDLLKAGFGSGS